MFHYHCNCAGRNEKCIFVAVNFLGLDFDESRMTYELSVYVSGFLVV